MSAVITEEYVDIGSPMKFTLANLKLESGGVDQDLTGFNFRCVVKANLDDEDDFANVNSVDDPLLFAIDTALATFMPLNATETASLEEEVIAPRNPIFINSKKLAGHAWLTVFFWGPGIGPEALTTRRINLLKPAL